MTKLPGHEGRVFPLDEVGKGIFGSGVTETLVRLEEGDFVGGLNAQDRQSYEQLVDRFSTELDLLEEWTEDERKACLLGVELGLLVDRHTPELQLGVVDSETYDLAFDEVKVFDKKPTQTLLRIALKNTAGGFDDQDHRDYGNLVSRFKEILDSLQWPVNERHPFLTGLHLALLVDRRAKQLQ